MLKHRRTLLWAGWLICVLSSAFTVMVNAAEPPDFPHVVNSWSSRQGLPGSAVICLVQSRDGYLWLGTQYGLVRFDGIHFTVFDEENTPGLDNDRIVFLFEDNETNLWVGTESSGLEMIHDGVIKNFRAAGDGSSGKVLYAYEDASSNVWFDASKGILRYHNGKVEFYPGVVSQRLLSLAQRIIVPSASGGYWGFFNGTVSKWENGRPTKDFGAIPWRDSRVTSACEDSDGNLIVGTLGAGVFWLQPDGHWRQISTEQGLSSVYVLSLCLDSDGNLWVGTDGGGLDQIKRKFFNAPPGLSSWNAQSLSEDARGGFWVAHGALGASYWRTNVVRNFQAGQYHDVWDVLVDHRQRVWAGTRDDGLFLFQTNHFSPAPGAEALDPQIFALFEDRTGELWVGTGNGLARWNGEDWKIYTTRDGLSGNAVCAIAEDSKGNLWVGTQNQGLDCFKDGKFTVFQQSANGLPGNDVSCLCADENGALWVGTFGHGLARWQNGKWTCYSSTNGLISNSISYVIADREGHLWIGSNLGLMRVKMQSLDALADGTAKTVVCRTYVENDGLPTRECSSGSEPAACRASDGELWFPTAKGVARVNPAALKPNLRPPAVMIESMQVDDREQKTNRLSSAWPPSIVVPPGHDQLQIHYTALNFSAPDAVRFRYRLEGRETTWTEAGDTRVAFYNKLPPGHYRFHVEACNEDGVWNQTGAALEIIVQPQFWQTAWFRVSVILALAGIVIAVVRYFSTQKLQRQLQKLRQQEALEKERFRIARDLHDQLGANLTQVSLLSEMAEADKDAPGEIESHARQISQTARETTRALDEIVWAVNPSNDTLDGLMTYACKYAQEYLALAGLRCRLDAPAQLPPVAIPPEVRHNVFLAFKEAVNNVVKHAQATEVWIRLRLQPGTFALEVEDNGRGMENQTAPPNRNGLRNMQKRMEDILGEFSISGGTNGGTIVRLKIPISTLSKS
jgi:ligand-binding sensor domain-containing protein/signal transduction histidine kinase